MKNNRVIGFCLIFAFIQTLTLFITHNLESKCFFDDWCDNLFLISYASNRLHMNWSFPILFNGEVIGSNVYLLYGYLFYPLTSFLALFFNAEIVVKAFIFLLQFSKILLIYRILSYSSLKGETRLLVSFIASWSIFSNSVYFSAGSLPSVMGSEIILVGILFLMYSGLCIDRRNYCCGSIFVLVGMLCWPGHIVHGAIIAAPLYIFASRKYDYKSIALTVVFAIIVSTPYFVELIKFAFNTPNYLEGLGWFSELDKFWNRVAPYPRNIKSILSGIKEFETPLFDTQVNIYAWIVLLVAAIITGKKSKFSYIFSIYFLLSLAYLLLSLFPVLTSLLPKYLTSLHFHYRYIYYAESVIIISLLAFLIGNQVDLGKFIKFLYVLVGCVLISIMIRTEYNVLSKGVMPFSNWGPASVLGFKDGNEKISYMFGADLFVDQEKKQKLLFEVPRTAAQIWSYSDIAKAFSGDNKCIDIPVMVESNSFSVVSNVDCYVRLPVFPFSGNKIFLNDSLVGIQNIYSDDTKLAVHIKVPAGKNSIKIVEYKGFISELARSIILLFAVLAFYGIFCIAFMRLIRDVRY
ncbi:hypothetical protein G6703_01655 [Polynucleobacter paneuropaeus]|nr:hypothetical protein G6703_01655 [Polynucleobacter paneuropaeus]